jgi:hypothetical protein
MQMAGAKKVKAPPEGRRIHFRHRNNQPIAEN